MAGRPIRFHPEAEREFLTAIEWYQGRSQRVGIDFEDEISKAVKRIATSPARWPRYFSEFRKYTLHEFPFSIVYQELPSELVVFAVAHGRRRPGYWRDRSISGSVFIKLNAPHHIVNLPNEIAVDKELSKLLYRAIQSKHLLRFTYKGNERIVEAHDYGIQNGIARLLCWQIGGKSSTRIPGWRLVDVEKIQNCEILDRQFSGGREVPGKHHRWDKLFIRVEASPK